MTEKNETTFTPGPWRIDRDIDSFFVEDQVGYRIASALDGCPGDEFQEHANAHLIAAAPVQNGALEKIHEMVERLIVTTPTGETRNALTDINIVALAALALARGEEVPT